VIAYPLLFTIYTSPIVSVIAPFRKLHHAQYADDTQLYIALSADKKSLSVTTDNTLSFDDHVNAVCKAAHFHIRALRRIRRCVSVDDAKSVTTALVSSRLDYCNSILYGTSTSNLNKLQRVQNALARAVMITK